MYISELLKLLEIERKRINKRERKKEAEPLRQREKGEKIQRCYYI